MDKTALLSATQIRMDPVLSGLNLTIRIRDIIHLQGENGSGKSSLLQALVLATPRHQARLILEGKSVDPQGIAPYRGRAHYLPQQSYIPDLSAGDYLRLPFQFACHAGKIFDADEARRLLNQFGLTDLTLEQPMRVLSGGEFQRLELIRSLLLRPSLQLLDEPTSALDRNNKDLFYQALFSFHAQRTEPWALLLVTHDTPERITVHIPPNSRYRRIQMARGKLSE